MTRIELDEVTLLHGDSCCGQGMPLIPPTSGAVGAEDEAEDGHEEKDGDGDDGKGCAPGRVRGETSVDQGLEEGDLMETLESQWASLDVV